MVVSLIVLVRTSASEPSEERTVLLNPESIARVEDSNDDGVIDVWTDGMEDHPYKIKGTVEEFHDYLLSLYYPEEEEPCEAACTDTE